MSESSFDAVVIGSGLGGLTAAALMAKAGRKVCVIERNSSVGGAASVFKVGALTIEPSLHQTADPRDPAEPKHAILKSLGLLDQIEWVAISPFLSVSGGPIGETFELPVGYEAAREAMAKRFPASRDGVGKLFDSMQRMQSCVAELNLAREEHSLRRALGGALKLRALATEWRGNVADALQRTLGDAEAPKWAIGGNLIYYTDDPRQLWWPFFAIAQGTFLKTGGVYIKGGSRVLSMKLAQIVMRSGGQVLLNRDATAVDFDAAGAIAGVRHVDTRSREAEARIAATSVFANCAPDVLAQMLPEHERETLDAAYRGRALSISLFTANFGLNVPPAGLGLKAYGQAVLPDWIERLDQTAESSALLGADPGDRMPIYGVANYSAIDSGLGDGPHLVTAVGADRLENWAHLSAAEEKARRQRWLDAFQASLDLAYPGFGAAVTDRIFLNARSMRGFLNTPGGAVYGFAPTPPTRGLWAGMPRTPKTPIPRLYLASSFGGSGGFTGAMLAGADAARLGLAESLRQR
jgi:phytoene dehydrogenase-like protein